MSQKNKEIIWLARAGQGAKTSSLLFALSALSEGYFVQAFPEYGPERYGAPMKVYNRFGNKFIRARTAIQNPDIIIVLDSSLLISQINEFKKVPIFLINSSKEPNFFKKKYNLSGKVFTLDATDLSLKYFKNPIPSIVMLGALFGLLNFDLKTVLPEIKKKLSEKTDKKIVEANLKIVKDARTLLKGNKF